MKLGWLLALLFLGSVSAACGFYDVQVDTSPTCSTAVDLQDAIIYGGEDFYICGKTDLIVTGIAFEKDLVQEQTVEVRNNQFVIKGQAPINAKPTAYFIEVNMTTCTEDIPLQIVSSCLQLPPSTIKAIPEKVLVGAEFTLEMANSDNTLDFRINGLQERVSGTLKYGEEWTQTFNSQQCCTPSTQDCSCKLSFSFSDPNHSACENSASMTLIVSKGSVELEENDVQSLTLALIATFVVLGTVGMLVRHYV